MDGRRAGRRIRRGLDVTVDLRRVWAFEHALGQHDYGQVPGRVNQPGRAQSTVPAERAAVVDRLAEPPGTAVEEPGKRPPRAFCAGVSWSVVIARTASGGSTGAPPRSSIRAKANRSSAVDTSPAAPSPKSGGRLHLPPGSSSTTSPPVVGWYAVARRWISAVQNP